MASTNLIKGENRDDGCFLAAVILLNLCPATGRGSGPGELNQYSYLLWAVRSGDRTPVCGEISRTRPDRPCCQSSLTCKGYRESFSGVKRLKRDVAHPPPSSTEAKETAQR